MRILPPITQPPTAPIERRHKPRPSRRWSDYRECLRWDFAFSCALCLLHETDLFGRAGGEGLAGTTAEHVVPRSVAPERAGDYDNLLYACRLCNTARSNQPTLHAGRRLLDPTTEAWSERFASVEDRLEPTPGDGDAAYTTQVYDVNDPRKVRRRQLRRRLLEDRFQLIAELKDEIDRLLQMADERLEAGDLLGFRELTGEAQDLRAQIRRAMGDLARFPVTPPDKPTTCRCPTDQYHNLPNWLAEQTIEVEV